MLRLLAIEWLKLRGYRAFWVLTILFVVLLFLTNFATSHGFFIKTNVDLKLFTTAYSFPGVWDQIGFWVRALGGLIPVFVIISTTNEIQYRTNRQNVIDGWSRAEFFHAKWLTCLMVALAVTLYSAALGAGFGFTYQQHAAAPSADPLLNALSHELASEPAEPGTGHLDRLGYVFLLVLNYSGLAMTLSFFLKRGALTVILFLSFTYVLEVIGAGILNHWLAQVRPGDYLPLQSSAGLLTFPIRDSVKKVAALASGPSKPVLALTSSAWLLFYYLVGWWKLRRSDW